MALIDDLFCGDPAKLDAWRLADDRGVLEIVENLLWSANQHGISGVEKLERDAASFKKFCNLVSELRFAVVFAQRGAAVRMLGDQCFAEVVNKFGTSWHRV